MRTALLLGIVAGACGCGVYLPDVWYDKTNGRMWENPSVLSSATYQEAQEHCGGLSAYGKSGWRVPTIDDLRSLARECDVLVSCQVSNTCNDRDTCYATNCIGGCAFDKGPGENGCFWDPALSGSCASYWSTTPVTGQYQSAGYVYDLSFSNAEISYRATSNSTTDVRCVRDGED